MTRLAPAAKTLLDEILAVDPDVGVTIGDPDGFGRARSIRLDEKAAKRFARALKVVAQNDERIARVQHRKGVTVSFVADVRADFQQGFDLADAVAVFDG